ncbi:thiamine pyrophosphate-binding protein [Gordonia sp. Z-3]|uniref:thiamine pyrophosphate-binding protein n=1 Tax=Gordonia sp. Z-3 TaxID=3115408 RepID=UPI002E2BCD1F|nr:thiamine pyrophosphate-binding protein [Gordonia sp. Z-3]MED5799949.1 thiamine pyrophosphate-binding protein [Gordonia sp. Z-3]
MTATVRENPAADRSGTGLQSTVSVADYIVQQLLSISVSVLYGVHGANIEDLYDAAIRQPGMTPVVAKHEFAAGVMADGTARVTGRPAAVMTTSGGGALNVVAALAESYDSRVPVLALVGTAPSALVGRGAFQDMLSPPDTIDIAGVMSAVTGSCCVVASADEVPAALGTALATLDRGLPAAILLPKDVQAASMSGPGSRVHRAPGSDVPGFDVAQLDRLAAELVAQVAATPGRVVIWAGEQASVAGLGGPIDELANALAATVVASPGGRDILRGGDGCAGVTGVMGHPSAHRALERSSVCLAVGCRMSMTDRAGLDEVLARQRTIHLGAHAPRLPGVDHHACDDLTGALEHLTRRVREMLAARPARVPCEITRLPVPPSTTRVLDMRTVVETVGAELPSRVTVFADAGNAGAAAIHHLPFGRGRFVVALGMGGMGYALAAGVGHAIRTTIAGGGARSVVIAGDGAFFMHGTEMHTAIEFDAPVTFVILNNNAHGMCITREQRFFPNTPSVNRFRPTDIAAGLTAMFPALAVSHPSGRRELRDAAAAHFSARGPNCLVVDVDPDEIPPFAPLLPKGPS